MICSRVGHFKGFSVGSRFAGAVILHTPFPRVSVVVRQDSQLHIGGQVAEGEFNILTYIKHRKIALDRDGRCGVLCRAAYKPR